MTQQAHPKHGRCQVSTSQLRFFRSVRLARALRGVRMVRLLRCDGGCGWEVAQNHGSKWCEMKGKIFSNFFGRYIAIERIAPIPFLRSLVAFFCFKNLPAWNLFSWKTTSCTTSSSLTMIDSFQWAALFFSTKWIPFANLFWWVNSSGLWILMQRIILCIMPGQWTLWPNSGFVPGGVKIILGFRLNHVESEYVYNSSIYIYIYM